MTGLENITAAIVNKAHQTADETAAAARARAEQINEQAQQLSKEQGDAIVAAAEQKAAAARAATLSSCALDEKNQLLNSRLALINECFDMAVQRLCALETNEYFNVIKKLVVRYAVRGEGVLVLSPADLSRCPSGFISLVLAALPEHKRITLSDVGDASIKGGCILRYDDIEINCEFSALVAEQRERLIDEINRILFN